MRSLILILSLGVLELSYAHDTWDGARTDAHAPVGVMGDHYHKKNEWMLSYRSMRMNMSGNRDGTNDLSTDQVLSSGFMVAPTEMSTEMHMLGLMYAYSDKLTFMAMLPQIKKEMKSVMSGTQFTTESEGIGDFRITGLYSLVDKPGFRFHLNLGMSLPTGSIDERDDTPLMADMKLPYPMQLGSGTYDLLIGGTAFFQRKNFSWGIQSLATVRTGENDNGYRLGNDFSVSTWAAKNTSPSTSLSARLKYQIWKNIHGEDDELNPNMTPAARTDLRAGERLDFLIGFNFYGKSGALKKHRLAFEIGVPIYQDLDGPQLKAKSQILFSWQYAFK